MSIREEITELSFLIKHYIQLLIKEFRLRQYELISGLIASVFITVLLVTLILCAVLVAIVALCLWLSEEWDSYALGFAGGAGVLLVLSLILFWGRKILLERPIQNAIIKIFTKD